MRSVQACSSPSAVMGGNLRGMSSFDIYPHGCHFHDFVADVYRFNALTSENQRRWWSDERCTWPSALAIVSLRLSGHVSPWRRIELGLVVRSIYVTQWRSPFFSWLSDLNAALGLGSSVVMRGWDGYVSARRRDADPFKYPIISQKLLMFWAWFSSWFLSMWQSWWNIPSTRFLSIN